MKWNFTQMTQNQAEDIAYNWHYDGEYSFYDIQADEEDFQEFIDPGLRGESFYVVEDNGELIGFFNFTGKQANTIEVGLGMRPDLTGKGIGLGFIEAGIEFAESNYCPDKLTLSVAIFNQRAIKVYKKAGFKEMDTFMQDTNGSRYEFVRMEMDV
ncbi:GNAT family N-acetyltransferase [Virgibacillus flavescens]|uniref:GNAT family N-acetyltransferase n=1 Tax=Virgibacillus flavescens TaxID=1611422 RepID=UPI003D3511B9